MLSFCFNLSIVISVVRLRIDKFTCVLFRWGLCASVDKVVPVTTVGPVSCKETAAVSPAWHSEATCSSDLSVLSTSFADIIRDELLQTATFEHTAKKSLALIQVW